jgi:3-hydroxyacyl-[acyl-carrier-protein] dehydratase
MAERKPPAMTPTDILRILPHRFPFLLVDRLEELTEGPKPPSRAGRKLKATKCVTFNEPFFQGHFPHRPVMPGVLLIEAMAQAAALACYRKDDPDLDVAIVSIKDAKFRRPVVPGDVLIIDGEVLRDGGTMLSVKLTCTVDGDVVAETEILAKVFPKQ